MTLIVVNRILPALLGGLFPNHCCLCQWRCPGAQPLCDGCRSELLANSVPCQRCALPLATSSSALCGACLQHPPDFDRVVAPWLYGEYLAYLLRCWKFEGSSASHHCSPGYGSSRYQLLLRWMRLSPCRCTGYDNGGGVTTRQNCWPGHYNSIGRGLWLTLACCCATGPPERNRE